MPPGALVFTTMPGGFLQYKKVNSDTARNQSGLPAMPTAGKPAGRQETSWWAFDFFTMRSTKMIEPYKISTRPT